MDRYGSERWRRHARWGSGAHLIAGAAAVFLVALVTAVSPGPVLAVAGASPAMAPSAGARPSPPLGVVTTQLSVGAGLRDPFGVAVDSAGDVYVADTGNGRVVKVSPGGTQTVVASGSYDPYGVALDSAGDLYIADGANARVVRISTTGVQTTVGSGFVTPEGVAVDKAGNVYVADNRALPTSGGGG